MHNLKFKNIAGSGFNHPLLHAVCFYKTLISKTRPLCKSPSPAAVSTPVPVNALAGVPAPLVCHRARHGGVCHQSHGESGSLFITKINTSGYSNLFLRNQLHSGESCSRSGFVQRATKTRALPPSHTDCHLPQNTEVSLKTRKPFKTEMQTFVSSSADFEASNTKLPGIFQHPTPTALRFCCGTRP